MHAPAPIPCAHCGTNFMRQSPDPEAPKLCNSCIIKEKNRPQPKVQDMNKAKILVECDRQMQIEVEEHCLNAGVSISDYFGKLHRDFHNKNKANAEEWNEESKQEFAQKFEESSKIGAPLGKKGKKK